MGHTGTGPCGSSNSPNRNDDLDDDLGLPRLPRVSEKPLTPQQKLREALDDVFIADKQLRKSLEPFQYAISHVSIKPLLQMGLSEKVLMAQSMIAILDELNKIGGH